MQNYIEANLQNQNKLKKEWEVSYHQSVVYMCSTMHTHAYTMRTHTHTHTHTPYMYIHSHT